MNTPRVFILMPHDKDIRRAEEFGELRYLFDDTEARASIWDNALVLEALARMDAAAYDPTIDYLLCVGPQVPLMQLIGALCYEWETPPRVLLWDMRHKRYVERVLGINTTEQEKVSA